MRNSYGCGFFIKENNMKRLLLSLLFGFLIFNVTPIPDGSHIQKIVLPKATAFETLSEARERRRAERYYRRQKYPHRINDEVTWESVW